MNRAGCQSGDRHEGENTALALTVPECTHAPDDLLYGAPLTVVEALSGSFQGEYCIRLPSAVIEQLIPDEPLSTWDDFVPVALSPDAARMSVIMRHVRARRAKQGARIADKSRARIEGRWDF